MFGSLVEGGLFCTLELTCLVLKGQLIWVSKLSSLLGQGSYCPSGGRGSEVGSWGVDV